MEKSVLIIIFLFFSCTDTENRLGLINQHFESKMSDGTMILAEYSQTREFEIYNARIRKRPMGISANAHPLDIKFELQRNILIAVPYNEYGVNIRYNAMHDERYKLIPEYLQHTTTRRFDDELDGTIFVFHRKSFIVIDEPEFEKLKNQFNDSLTDDYGIRDAEGFMVLPPQIAAENEEMFYNHLWQLKNS